MRQSDQSKSNNRKAMVLSLLIHAVFALLFFFLLAWREPNPPIPEYGIELNFGLDNVGSGEIQTDNPPSEQNDDATSEIESEEIEPSEILEPTEVIEPSESNTPVVVEDELPTHDSPDVREPEKKETPTVAKVEKNENSTNISKTSKEPVKQPTKTDGDTPEPNKKASGNQGDDLNKTGDKGDPQGSLDARAMYGTAGAGGGASLDLAGWNWDELPRPNDTSNETGKIVFQITIDDQGYVIGITTVESTVNPAVEKIYRDEVRLLTFSRKNDGSGAKVAQTTKGKITFILRNK